jgi:uncharacterized membrane protein
VTTQAQQIAKKTVQRIAGGWHRHPGVRSDDQLTRGERAADKMRNGMGSWGFVFGALAFLFAWMALNVIIDKVGHGKPFDGYPFILLNLVLSCVAALQGAILLIAAKRSDQVSSELAQHDYEADCRSRELLEKLSENFDALTAQHAELHAQNRVMAEQLAKIAGANA